jgi:hypothetical protein
MLLDWLWRFLWRWTVLEAAQKGEGCEEEKHF